MSEYLVNVDILSLSDTNKAVKSLDDDEKLTRKIFGSGQERKMWVINESGLYARDIPYGATYINRYPVRCIELEGTTWLSINDVNEAIHSRTDSAQCAKKLNARKQLAIKVWIFGNTTPAWFVNELGLQLIMAGSRKLRSENAAQLRIDFKQ